MERGDERQQSFIFFFSSRDPNNISLGFIVVEDVDSDGYDDVDDDSYKAPGNEDVRSKILYYGICHSDLHCVKNE
ncbi:putative cinnamyl alcohol dehydrogenase 3 [Camellia lanceoleosa]|uniref:Cinnamyl alcohol dehydrogenase 3 n=1 Tax=Camellia lanceoleosa TaxID=1840588 RepID=A0ACC0F4H7_9ERIC|nr:putative cinnamyl alcohol dehydrogenase 3 [Camellia lanceoleosa]